MGVFEITTLAQLSAVRRGLMRLCVNPNRKSASVKPENTMALLQPLVDLPPPIM